MSTALVAHVQLCLNLAALRAVYGDQHAALAALRRCDTAPNLREWLKGCVVPARGVG